MEKGKVRVTASRFPVTDTELIRKQLLEHVKFMEIHDLIKKEENEGGSSMQDRKLLHGDLLWRRCLRLRCLKKV